MSNNNNNEKNKKYNLKIIGDNFELSTTGELSEIQEKLDEIVEFIEELNLKLGAEIITEEIPTEEEVQKAPAEEVPVIKPSRSTMDNIMMLFEQNWGSKPRSAAEVMKALEINAVPENPATVSTYLRRLVKRGILRRIQREGLWHYYKIPETTEE